MTWLAPAAFAALGLLAVPVLLHLAAALQRDTKPFPSLVFLRQTRRRRRRLRRLRDPWLFVLRVLAVLALVAAFAEPVLNDRAQPLVADAAPALILVDRSASMSRLADFDDARRMALQALDSLAGRPVALASFDTRFALHAPFGTDAAGLRTAIEQLAGSGARGNLNAAAETAGRLLTREAPRGGTLVIISDLQAAANGAMAAPALPGGIEVRLLIPAARPPGEVPAAVTGARLAGVSGSRVKLALDVRGGRSDGGDGDGGVRFVLHAATGPVAERAGEGDEPGGPLEFELVRATDRDEPLEVRVDGDSRARWWGVLPALPPRRVAIIDGGDSRARLFTTGALSLAGGQQVRLVEPDAEADVALGPLDALARWPGMSAHLARGGAVLALPPVDAVADDVPDWSPLAAMQWRESEAPTRLAQVAAGHPLDAAIGGDESQVHGVRPVWRYVGGDLRDGASAVMWYATGAPALLEHRAGASRVLMLTTSPAPPASELGLGANFAPLIIEAVKHLTPRPARPVAQPVGEPVDVRQLFEAGGAGQLTVRAPGGAVVVLAPNQDAVELAEEGLYRVLDANGRRRLVAANVPAEEWRLDRVQPQAWRDGVVALPSVTGSEAASAARAGDGARQRPLSALLLLVALALFLFEALTGNHLTRRRGGAEVQP